MFATSNLPSPLKSPTATDTVNPQQGPVEKVVGTGKAKGKVCACPGTSTPATITTAKSIADARADRPWRFRRSLDCIFCLLRVDFFSVFNFFGIVLPHPPADFRLRSDFGQWTGDSGRLVPVWRNKDFIYIDLRRLIAWKKVALRPCRRCQFRGYEAWW